MQVADIPVTSGVGAFDPGKRFLEPNETEFRDAVYLIARQNVDGGARADDRLPLPRERAYRQTTKRRRDELRSAAERDTPDIGIAAEARMRIIERIPRAFAMIEYERTDCRVDLIGR